MKTRSILAAALLLLCACSSDTEEPKVKNQEPITVTLNFIPYDMQAMSTRTAVSIADIVSMLDVWIYESGSEACAVHQSSGDETFGSIAVTLDKTKTYTLYAVAHKGNAAATLEDGVISFPDDKVTQTMYYTTSFSPESTTSLSCLMQRIVGQLKIESTDAMPDDVEYVTLSIASTATRYNVNGTPANITDRVVTFSSISKKNDGTVSFTTNIISTGDAATNFDITFTAYNSTEEPIQYYTFDDVPIRNGYKTIYRGLLFRSKPVSATFTVNDWIEYDVFNF